MRRVSIAVLAAALVGACVGSPVESASGDSTGAAVEDSTGVHATTTTTSTGDDDHAEASTAADGDGSGSGDAPDLGTPALGAPYPIVLVHGFFGFDELAGLEAATYFNGVVPRLALDGELEIYTPALDPFNDSTVRGMQLLEHVEAIVASTGRAKVNLVGHSQGGLDARVVAHLRPDLVASVTTIATPHLGTPIADLVLDGGGPGGQALADELAQLLGGVLWSELDGNSSVAVALAQLGSEGIATFNATYTDAPGVPYRSIGGRSSLAGVDDDCEAADVPDYIAAFEDARDPVDPALAIAAGILSADLLDPIANDGLVRAIDAHWGEFRGCIPADHLDEVGQLFGDGPGIGNPWQHLEFYAALVAELRDDGF